MAIAKLKRHFDDVYGKEVDGIWRFCLWKVSDGETALDLVQECFMRYWDELAKGTEIGNDRAFLYTLARRLVIDWYRKKKPVSLEGLATEDDDPFEVPDEGALDAFQNGAEARRVIAAIANLDPSCRQAVYLRHVEGLGPKEIAEVLGITPGAVSVRIHRGMQELRKRLDPQHGR